MLRYLQLGAMPIVRLVEVVSLSKLELSFFFSIVIRAAEQVDSVATNGRRCSRVGVREAGHY